MDNQTTGVAVGLKGLGKLETCLLLLFEANPKS